MAAKRAEAGCELSDACSSHPLHCLTGENSGNISKLHGEVNLNDVDADIR